MYKYVHQDYESSNHYVDYILKEAKNNKNSIKTDKDNFLLITTLLWEPHLLNDFNLYKKLFESFTRKKIKTVLIINSYYKEMDLSNLKTEIYYIDYFLWRTYDKIINQKKCKFSSFWNKDATKFLFLTGKPHYKNRIRLLYKIIKKDLIKKCIWSFFIKEETQYKCRQVLSDISDNEFNEMFKYYNNPDQANIMFQLTRQNLHYGGIPYDSNMYQNSLFRIIAETTLDVKIYSPWLTEKTFITILNNIPFIMAGSDPGSLNKLKKIGFKTFENFLPVTDYDNIENDEERLEAIITNTDFWINHMKNKEEIQEDINNNYNRLIELAQENKVMLEDICKKYLINPIRIGEICTTYDILGNE